MGGRWNDGAQRLLHDLVRLRAQRAPPALRRAATSAWARRWSGMLAAAVQQAAAGTALGPHGPQLATSAAGNPPNPSGPDFTFYRCYMIFFNHFHHSYIIFRNFITFHHFPSFSCFFREFFGLRIALSCEASIDSGSPSKKKKYKKQSNNFPPSPKWMREQYFPEQGIVNHPCCRTAGCLDRNALHQDAA